MKTSRKRIFTLSLALLMGLGASLQAQAVTLPTTTISFASLPKATYGNPDIALSITQSAGVTTTTSATPTICSLVNNTTVHIITAGVCKITAANPGDLTHKPARDVSRSFTIAKAANVVTLSNFSWLSMANPTADLTTTQTSGLTTVTSLSPNYCTLTGARLTAIKVGTCAVRAANPGNANYLAAKTVSVTFKIGLTSTVTPPVIPPVTPPATYVGPWKIRQTTFDDTTSVNDVNNANSWVANNWYHPGLRFQIAQVVAKSTTRISYLVTDSLNRPTPNKVVNFSVGKRDGGSNARVQVGTQTTTGVDRTPQDQLLLTATTDSNGVVSFDITGLDTTARVGLFVQLAAWITDLAVDTIDITNLEYSIPVGGVVTPPVVPPVTNTRTLLWSDEFNGALGTAPSSSNWTPDLGDGCDNPAGCGWGNGEAQAYAACANKADGAGSMIITSSTTAGDATCTSSRAWTSGKFTSYGKKHFGYGYFEARLKMPSGGGTWPAFWTLGSNINSVPWPGCGELDIVEYAGNSPFINTSAAHYPTNGGWHEYQMGALNNTTVLSAGYHNYAMLWLPTEVTFYIDDRQVANIKKSALGLTYWPFGPNAAGVNPKMYIIFNLAMGGSYGGGIASGLNKAQFSIDYFRYYASNAYGTTPTNN
jgi:beta-glucanase (GH16 family)